MTPLDGADKIFFDGVSYIAAREAAREIGIVPDYITRLCRQGKIRGRRVGKNWYVEVPSLRRWATEQEHLRALRNEALARERTEEYRAAQSPAPDQRRSTLLSHVEDRPTEPKTSAAFLAPQASRETHRKLTTALSRGDEHAVSRAAALASRVSPQVSLYAISPGVEFLHKLIALTIAFMLTFGTFALVDPQTSRFAAESIQGQVNYARLAYQTLTRGGIGSLVDRTQTQVAAAAENPGGTVASLRDALISGVPEIAARFARALNSKLNSFVYSIAFPLDLTQSRGAVAVDIQPYASVKIPSNVPDTSTSSPPLAPSPRTVINQPVIERVIETQRIVAAAGGITDDILSQRLNQLDNKLSSRMYALTSASSPPASGGLQNQIAITQRIDRLSNTDIASPTIHGGSIDGTSITGSSVNASSLSVSGGSTLASTTVNGDLAVNGNATITGTIAIPGALTISSSTIALLTSAFATTSNFSATNASTTYLTWLDATGTNTSLTNATSTNFFATNASTTNATSTNLFSVLGTLTSGIITTLTATIANITGLTATNATTTNATSTNFYSSSFVAGNATTTNATSTRLYATSLAGLNATTTNFTATYATTTYATSTNFFATNLSGQNASTTNATSSLLYVSGNARIDGGFGVGISTTSAGVLQTSGNAYIGGNLTVIGNSVTLGTSTATSLVINSAIKSDLVPDQNITRNLGSPSFYWNNAYVGTLNANNISAASTTIGGTSNASFTVNSANATADTQNSSLIFFRGSVVPNGLLTWNSAASAKRFEFNQSLYVQNASASTTEPTVAIQSTAGQSANIFQVASSTGTTLFSVGPDGSVTAPNLTLTGSTTFQNFTFQSATGTAATTTDFFSSVASSTNLFAQFATLGSLTLSAALGATSGGTGQSAVSTGDILYGSGSNTWSRLGASTNGFVLGLSGGIPAWVATTTLATIGGSLNLATQVGSSILPVANGGTNASSFGTTNGVTYYDGTRLVNASGLTFDGTKLTAIYASTTNLTASNSAYLASAGGTVGIGTTSPSKFFSVQGDSYFSGNIANVANVTATGTLAIGGAITSTANAANTLPYASSTAVTVSGTASTSNFVASNSFTFSNVNGFLKAVAGVVTTSLVDLTSNVTGILPVGNGGTGWAAVAAGAVPYGNGSSALSTTTQGTGGQVLALVNGVPAWQATTTLSTISGTLAETKGGTNQTSYATGDILYASGVNTLSKLAASTNGFTLALVNGVPAWQATTTLTTISGSLNLATQVGSSILPIANGGTNASSFGTANGVTYYDGTRLVNASGLTFDGTKLTATYASTTNLTASNSAYLASAGGTVGIATTSPWAMLAINPTAGSASNEFAVGSSTLTTFLITNGGFVGIGTTSPSKIFSVQGDSYFSGNIANVANVTATGTLAIGGAITSTANAANTLPYASSTAVTVSGTASTSNFVASNSFTFSNVNGFLKAVAGVVTTSLVDLTSNVTGILPVGNGGTGWAAIQSGSIPYGNGSSALSTTTQGTGGQVLALLNGVPSWSATTTFSAGLQYANGNVTNTGVLSVTQNGGGTAQTGAISFSTSSATSFNGLTISHTITNSGGAFTFNTPTISGTLGVGGGGTGLTAAADGALLFGGAGGGTANLTALATTTGAGRFLALDYTTGRPSWLATTSLGVALSDTTGTLAVNRGGTGKSSYTPGDILYANSASTLLAVASSTDGFVLALQNGAPSWVATTTLSTITGTLSVGKGGTGQTSLSAGQVVYGSGTNGVGTVATSSIAQGGVISVTNGSAAYVLGSQPTITTAPGTFAGAGTYNFPQVLGVASTTPWAFLAVNPTDGIASNEFAVGSSTATALIVDNGGRIGIATTAPSTNFALAVTGAGYFSGGVTLGSALGATSGGTGQSAVSTGDLLYGSGTNVWSRLGGGTNGFTLAMIGGVPSWVATTTLTTISGSLNLASQVGASILPVANGGTNASSFGTTNGVTYYDGTRLVNNSGLIFDGTKLTATYASTTNLTASNSAYLATAAGSVGIGTTNPFRALDVRSALFVGNTDFVGGSAGSGSIVSMGASSGNTYTSLQAYTSGANAVGNLILNLNGGNVGIGTTSPSTLLHVAGTSSGAPVAISVDNSANTASSYESIHFRSSGVLKGFIGYENNASRLDLGNGGNPSVSIASGGNVGVGTTSPTKLFSVHGDSFFSGNISNVANVTATGTVSANSASFTTALGATSGGTGQSAVSTGDLLYGSGTNVWSRLGGGTNGFTLAMVGGVPSWVATTTLSTISGSLNLASQVGSSILPTANGGTGWANLQANTVLLGNGSGAVATTSAGTNGQVLALVNGVPTWQATTTLTTISGILPIANGGTNASSFGTTNGVTYYDGTRLVNNSGLTFDGTKLTATYASTTNITASNSAYLATAGGNVGIGTTNPVRPLDVAVSKAAGSIVAAFDNTNNASGLSVVAVFGGLNSNDTTTHLIDFYDYGGNSFEGGIVRNGAAAVAYGTASDRRIKENIATTTAGLSTLMQIPVDDFSFISDPTHKLQQGFIAQSLYSLYPEAVSTNGDNGIVPLGASSTPWGVDYGRITPLIVKAVQDIANLSDMFKNTLIAWFASAANGITDLFARTVHAKQFCAQKSDGTEVCVNGDQLAALLSGQSAVASSGGGGEGATIAASASSSSSAASSSPPVLQINGDNPATIVVGATYSDLGATITAPAADTNLDIKVAVDGGATTPDQITIDTSAVGTHTIIYSATDQAGLTGTATRTVIVVVPQAANDNQASSTPPAANDNALPLDATGTTATSTP
jgi:hypothetical protein